MEREVAEKFESSSFQWNWYSLCAVLISECIGHALWHLTDYEIRPLRHRQADQDSLARLPYRLLHCLSVTVWLFPIHLRDVQRNINSSKHRRGGERWMWVEGSGALPQNAPSSNFSPSALIVLQLSLFSSAVHLTVNIITGLDRTSVNSIRCSV